jgi:hypothetical protein
MRTLAIVGLLPLFLCGCSPVTAPQVEAAIQACACNGGVSYHSVTGDYRKFEARCLNGVSVSGPLK